MRRKEFHRYLKESTRVTIVLLLAFTLRINEKVFAEGTCEAHGKMEDIDFSSTSPKHWPPSIVIETAGKPYIAWVYYNSKRDRSSVVCTTFPSKNYPSGSKDHKVSDVGPFKCKERRPCIALGSNGNVYVAWDDTRNGDPDIYFARSTDGGKCFKRNVRVNDAASSTTNQWDPSIAVGPMGDIYVAWTDERNTNLDIYFAKSTDRGKSFETDIRIGNETPPVSYQCRPLIAVGPNRNIYVVWVQGRNGNFDIYLARSTDGGKSFKAKLRVNDVASSGNNQWDPSIAVGPKGNLYVAWTDERNSTLDIYFARSTDGGKSFETDIRLKGTNYPTSHEWAPCVTANRNGDVYLAWVGDRRGLYRSDIHFAESTDGGDVFKTTMRRKDSESAGREWSGRLGIGPDAEVCHVCTIPKYRTLGLSAWSRSF